MRPHRPAPAWASAPIHVEMPEELGDPNAPAPSDPTAKPRAPDHNIHLRAGARVRGDSPHASIRQRSPLLRMRRGRLVFRARRPAALVVPLAAVTETAGILFVLNGATIGWFVVAAPVAALLFTGVLFRPSLELTREGLVHRQYPFTQMNLWDNIDSFDITRAGNRLILGYRLVEGARKPRRQPAAALLRAARLPFDGGYFADSIAAPPEVLLATVEAYLRDPERRAALPPARR